jgi:dolichol-phosphate mannosyltransferase
MIDLSVIIPVFNEEKNIEELYTRLKQTIESLNLSYELVFVNDGSIDNSFDKIYLLAETDKSVKYIDLSRNFGHQIAVTAGVDFVEGKNTVIIDADLQDPPEVIIELYNKMQEGFDVVYAKRKKRKGDSILKKVTAKVFYRVLSKITNIDIPVDTGDFRIMSYKVVNVLKNMPEQHKFIRGQISWAGFRQAHIEYIRNERFAGETGYTYGKMTKFAKDGITAFSDFPLKLVTWMGFTVALLAFGVMVYAIYSKYIMGGAVPGWASLMISLLFLGGVQLIGIGIIGEYISRIASNVRNRPLYIVNKKNIE